MKVASLALGLALAGCMAGAEVPRVTTLPVGQWPEDLVFDSGSGCLFVANEGDGSLTALDGRSGQVLFTVPVGRGPGGVAVDPATARVFVVSVKEDQVVVVDGARGLPIATIPVRRGPTHLRVNGKSGI